MSDSKSDIGGQELGAWPCGHPRTDQNTQRIGKAGIRCRECRRAISRESFRRRFGFYDRLAASSGSNPS